MLNTEETKRLKSDIYDLSRLPVEEARKHMGAAVQVQIDGHKTVIDLPSSRSVQRFMKGLNDEGFHRRMQAMPTA